MKTLRHTGYMALRDLRAMWRQPWYVAMTLVQPIIWLLLFGEQFASVTDLPGLKRVLAEVRRLGYALNDQETFLGDISVAAALVDRGGSVVGAINIAVPSPRWKLDDVRRKLAPRVVATARDIGAELGVL